jgi:hypothetical protein
MSCRIMWPVTAGLGCDRKGSYGDGGRGVAVASRLAGRYDGVGYAGGRSPSLPGLQAETVATVRAHGG